MALDLYGLHYVGFCQYFHLGSQSSRGSLLQVPLSDRNTIIPHVTHLLCYTYTWAVKGFSTTRLASKKTRPFSFTRLTHRRNNLVLAHLQPKSNVTTIGYFILSQPTRFPNQGIFLASLSLWSKYINNQDGTCLGKSSRMDLF